MRTATQEEITKAIQQAEYDKARLVDWRNRSAGLKGVSVETMPLTEEEIQKLTKRLNDAIYIKEVAEAHAEASRKRIKEEAEQLKAEWNAAGFLKLMRRESLNRGVKLVENEYTLPLIKTVCFKLSGDERYETELGLSFSKGLIIHGEPGLGKSYLWQLVAKNPLTPVQIVTMHEIVRDVVDNGDYKGLKFNTYKLNCIDDVGTEYFGDNAIKRYGTDVNWFKTFIEEYYSKFKPCFNRLIITTNDSADELGRKYGFRVRDRLAEVFDVIDVTGKSFRR